MQELREERYQRHTLISLFLMSRVSKRLFECTVQYNVLLFNAFISQVKRVKRFEQIYSTNTL